MTALEQLLAQAARLLAERRPADAIPFLQDAARLQPTNAKLQHDLGLACLEAGRPAEAIAALHRAIALDPTDADSHFRMGIARETMGDLAGAVRDYDRATQLKPALTEAWFRAGAIVFTLGHRDEAIGCFRRAAATGRNTRFGRLGEARALLTEGRDSEAEKVLRKALTREPDDPMALDLLGTLLSEAGQFDAARDCFARAVAAAPLMAGTYYDLVRCRRIIAADADVIPKMEAALDTPGLEPAQRLRLHLALGKAADDLGNHALAMKHLDLADDVRRASTSFDASTFDAQVQRIIARCSPELMAEAQHTGLADATPILIVGMPRSGTTLVEQIISNHPDVAAGGELNFWNERGAAWCASGQGAGERDFIQHAAKDYLGVLRAISSTSRHVSDKMPFNFLWAGLIHLAFPNATILHCRRRAIDTALSIHQTHFHPGLAFPTGGSELVSYFRSYRNLTDHWRRVLPHGRFIEIDYENLTAAPEPEIRRIVASCGLAWHDACLQPERNPRAVKTPSKWQTRQPINRSSIERWRHYEPWLGALRPLLDDDSRG